MAHIHTRCVWHPFTPVFLASSYDQLTLDGFQYQLWIKPKINLGLFQSIVTAAALPPCYARSLSFFLHPLIRYSVSKVANPFYHLLYSSIKPKLVPPATPACPSSTLGHSSRVTFSLASSKCQLLNNHTLMLVLQTSSLVSNLRLWVCSSFCPPSLMFPLQIKAGGSLGTDFFFSCSDHQFWKGRILVEILRCLLWHLSANS